MRYYLIVGETSGELHASNLMRCLKERDPKAEFRYIGGPLMSEAGGTCVKNYKEMAYMGFVPVLLHLRTIFRNMAFVKHDIVEWQPDAVILVDYAGFNLNIAKYLHAHTRIPVFYYISPKIWAWKEWRIRSIKRDVDEMFSILPFETHFYEDKHHYRIHYVGNPTADEVRVFRSHYNETFADFCTRQQLSAAKPIIALLAGSRKQEIKDNLPTMLKAASSFTESYQLVLACAPSIDDQYYQQILSQLPEGTATHLGFAHDTYALLSHSTAALVTSGTATLETSLFGVPQVVCYETPLPHLIRFAFNHVIKVKYISLVNLILDREAVSELFADKFSAGNIRRELRAVLPGGVRRERMLKDYSEIKKNLGDKVAPENASFIMVDLLRNKYSRRRGKQ